MPFDDEDNEQPSLQSQKIGLKKPSSQKSIFESMPKKPTQQDLDASVKRIQEKAAGHQSKAADLTMQFNQLMADKTLPQNKNLFQKEVELELLRNMVKFAQEMNSSPQEAAGEGSLIWIILLLKNSFAQRDKINNLEYQVAQLSSKIDQAHLSALITKEIEKALDNKKKDE